MLFLAGLNKAYVTRLPSDLARDSGKCMVLNSSLMSVGAKGEEY